MKFEKKHWMSLLISMGVTLVLILLYAGTNLFDKMELLMVNQQFYMRNDKPAVEQQGGFTSVKVNKRLNKNIMIIGIDESSLAVYGQFPWNRKVYADLIDHLKGSNPSIIFFDIFFPEYAQDAEGDRAFWAGLKRGRNIIVDYPFYRSSDTFNMEANKERFQYVLRSSWPKNPTAKYMKEYNNAAIPIPEILRSIDDIAEAVIEPDMDQTVRQAPLVLLFKDRLVPFIPLSIARKYFKVKHDNIELNIGKFIKMKGAEVPKFNEFGEITGKETMDIIIPVDKEGKMTINFVGFPSEFKTQSQYLSFAEAMATEPSTFDNKILMIGAFAQGMAHDIWPTPHGNMYGIEINANALNTILNRDFIRTWPKTVNYLLLLLIGLFMGLVLPRMKIALSAIVSIALLIASILSGLLVFIFANTVMLYFAPLLVIVFTFAGIIVYRVLTEEKEKTFIRKRFSNFVSANVVEELLKNPKALQLGGENRELTVQFSDIRGFTTISEKLGDPQKLVALLNEYLGSMTEIVQHYDGTLDKYIGDAIMCFWGAPMKQEDHAIKACMAAVDQLWYLNNVLNPKFKSEGRPEIEIGIGLNSGIMTAGNMGSIKQMSYTLMGDNVNLGSRLEGTNKVYHTHIIISEYTYEMVKGRILARELDNIKVKGKSKPVKIYELIAVKDHDESQMAEILRQEHEQKPPKA